MHGLVFNEFKKYIVHTFDPAKWTALSRKVGLDQQIFLPDHVYLDAQFLALIQAAAAELDVEDPHALQESFGQFIGPHLMHMYRYQVNPSWRSLDLIENVETAIHRVVRIRDPTADPPRLQSTRTSQSEVRIHYTSARGLCGVAKGIARGVAGCYGERLEIWEDRCMQQGDNACDIRFQLADASNR